MYCNKMQQKLSIKGILTNFQKYFYCFLNSVKLQQPSINPTKPKSSAYTFLFKIKYMVN